MFCKNCGAKLADGSSFCSVCGAKQEFSDNIEIIPRDAKELTNEEIYQADLNKKKKRLIIVGWPSSWICNETTSNIWQC